MSVPFKKIKRKKPGQPDAVGKYYPQLVTLGLSVDLDSIAYVMKEKSSLSLGDIQSVLTNFVEAMRSSLYDGKSVNIQNFGVFSLSARTVGTEKVEDCTVKSIKAVRINFRPSSSVRPNLTSTRAGERLEFIDIETALLKKEEEGGGSSEPSNPGGGGGDLPDPKD